MRTLTIPPGGPPRTLADALRIHGVLPQELDQFRPALVEFCDRPARFGYVRLALPLVDVIEVDQRLLHGIPVRGSTPILGVYTCPQGSVLRVHWQEPGNGIPCLTSVALEDPDAED